MRLRAALLAATTLLAACSGGTVAADGSTSSPPPPTVTSSPPTTETTTAPTTSATPPESTAPREPVVVGVVGCSMSRNSIDGYEGLGGKHMWPPPAAYSGGSIGRWVLDITDGRAGYWEWFDRQLEAHPETGVVWWNLCTFKAAGADSFEAAERVLEQIEARAPGVEIFVSAQPAYEGHLCEIAGAAGPTRMAEVAGQLVATGLVKAGPIMGPLQESDTSDGCHAAESGEELLGRQLLDFFG